MEQHSTTSEPPVPGESQSDVGDPLEVEESGETSEHVDPADIPPSNPPASAYPFVDKTKPFPADPAHFAGTPLTPSLIRALLEEGPCQPLFADRKDCHYEPTWSNAAGPGFSNWKKATQRISEHESSGLHMKAQGELMMTRLRLSRGAAVNEQQIREHERQVQRNRDVLTRLIDVALFLAKHNLAFRGHRESRRFPESMGTNDGNFLELVRLLSKYDKVLEEHLQGEGHNTSKYLSPSIQNELIESLRRVVEAKILDEVKAVPFFSIIADSAIDVSHSDQLSISLRYVDATGDIQERFMCVEEVFSTTSEVLFDFIENALLLRGLSFENCFGQSYDGAANMSGSISGLQSRIKAVHENALYVHCCAHNLNLVLTDACSSCTEGKSFFGTIEKLYVFLTNSHPRLEMLEAAKPECLDREEIASTPRLKRIIDTRWSSRVDAVRSVRKTYPAILMALENVQESERRASDAAEAGGLIKAIISFEFLVLLHFWEDILSKTNSLSEYMQSTNMDINSAAALIASTEEELRKHRSDQYFGETLEAAKELASRNGVSQEFNSTGRVRRRKRMPGEEARDEPIEDPQARFRVNGFLKIYDTVLEQLDTRFNDFRGTVTHFSSLVPAHFDDEDVEHKVSELAIKYRSVLTHDQLLAEYNNFRTLYKMWFNESVANDIPSTIRDIIKFVIINKLEHAYPNLTRIYRIAATMPVSSATAERCFSRIKLIKSHLRSTMSQERLTGLALLSIEKDVAVGVDFTAVIDYFAKMRDRRVEFI